MPSIRERLSDDLKTAMKAGEKDRVDTVRLIIAKMKEADVNARTAGKEVGDPELMAIMQTMLKQRGESELQQLTWRDAARKLNRIYHELTT